MRFSTVKYLPPLWTVANHVYSVERGDLASTLPNADGNLRTCAVPWASLALSRTTKTRSQLAHWCSQFCLGAAARNALQTLAFQTLLAPCIQPHYMKTASSLSSFIGPMTVAVLGRVKKLALGLKGQIHVGVNLVQLGPTGCIWPLSILVGIGRFYPGQNGPSASWGRLRYWPLGGMHSRFDGRVRPHVAHVWIGCDVAVRCILPLLQRVI